MTRDQLAVLLALIEHPDKRIVFVTYNANTQSPREAPKVRP